MPGVATGYLHGDLTTPNKGGSLVTVLCETDFGAKTDVFKLFAEKVAKIAYAASSQVQDDAIAWSAIIELFPEIEEERKRLEEEIGETVRVLPAAVQQVP